MVSHPPRVVSLIASSTEIVAAIGCADRLVGISHECDFPPEILDRPRCSSPTFPVHGSSAEIDAQVKATLSAGEPLYQIDAQRLADLKPDVILTQKQCAVCAVSDDDVATAVSAVPGLQPEVVALNTNCMTDLWHDIAQVAEAVGEPTRGTRLVASLKQHIETLKATVADAPVVSVACIEWIEPLMCSGNWMPECIAFAGGQSCFGIAGRHSPVLTMEQLCARNPDVILLSPCGWDIERTRQDLSAICSRDEWQTLKAVRERRVMICDGNAYFNRPSPRLVDSIALLIEVLHPSTERRTFYGAGWQPLEWKPLS